MISCVFVIKEREFNRRLAQPGQQLSYDTPQTLISATRIRHCQFVTRNRL